MRGAVTILIDRGAAGRYADATSAAVAHAANRLGSDVEIRELPTRSVDDRFLGRLADGLVIGPGSPYDEPDAVYEVIRSARQRGVPLVGT